ncbi:MAG: GNAT family N-acetyltransferase [Comamonadaceae bacterium]|nr:MAG: GNAT family N-acetyltransferase [Comamonadaceae bacterium]
MCVAWARTPAEVREAQRLRFQVFATEVGARLSPPAGTPPGLDVDRFDPHCDHLLVRAGSSGPVVGTYRVLPPDRARVAGGWYGESEFDLAPLQALRPRALELGRSCVHADWRSGGVILAMWSALAAYMVRRGLDSMVGCASIGLAGGPEPALAVWDHLRRTHMAAPAWRVRPWQPLPGAAGDADGHADDARAPLPASTPPLLKGYLRCGARVLGPPALDAAFNTADLPLLLRLEDMAPRYRRHLLDAA